MSPFAVTYDCPAGCRYEVPHLIPDVPVGTREDGSVRTVNVESAVAAVLGDLHEQKCPARNGGGS